MTVDSFSTHTQEYYKRWLCASRLAFFASSNLTTAPPSTNSMDSSSGASEEGLGAAGSDSSSGASEEGSGASGLDSSSGACEEGLEAAGLKRIRPCLGVCYDVLQTCPYYLPSKYQPRNDSDEPYEVTYGGYPAFDCPRKESEYCCVCACTCNVLLKHIVCVYVKHRAGVL